MKIVNVLGCSGQNSKHGQESSMSGILKPKILISYILIFSPQNRNNQIFLKDIFSFLIISGEIEAD